MIQVTIRGEIKTKQRPRATVIGGHARVYSSKDTIMYENYVKYEYQRQCPYYFENKPLKATIIAYFLPPNELAKYGEDVKFVACTKNKDLDNIAKTILDALNGIAYEDDKQIVELHCEKYWSTNSTEYIEVKIDTVDGDFVTIDDLKEKTRKDKLWKRFVELLNKEKLTSAENKRFNELKEILKIEEKL